MHNSKGQSATEYLMTYGWAILAIAIVGGLLYVQVFSDRACATEGAKGFNLVQGVVPDNNEFSLTTDGTLSIALVNHAGSAATISSVRNNEGTTIDVTDTDVVAGGTAVLTVSGFSSGGSVGDCYSLGFTAIYNTSASGIAQSSSGTLNGRY